MSYERAMGTEDAGQIATVAIDRPEEIPREERIRLMADAEQRRQQELDEMWETGRWREKSMFDRWLNQRMGVSRFRLLGIASLGLRTWLSSAHCLFVLPGNEECSNLVMRERGVAWVALLWPLVTGYYAWRKSNGSKKWTAVGAAAGVATCTPVSWVVGVMTGMADLNLSY